MRWKITDGVVLERYQVPSVTSQRLFFQKCLVLLLILQKCEKVHKVNMEPFSFLGNSLTGCRHI